MPPTTLNSEEPEIRSRTLQRRGAIFPSMKVPPKRKGNFAIRKRLSFCRETLNESPSEKEGKSRTGWVASPPVGPSMKVPPKRKGNPAPGGLPLHPWDPQ